MRQKTKIDNIEIIPLEHKHAVSYIIKGSNGCVMFDAGWADSYRVFARSLKEKGLGLKDIAFFAVSHFHPDHAGSVQMLKRSGVKFYLHECQKGHTGWLNDYFIRHPDDAFVPIEDGGNNVLTSGAGRILLSGYGISGEIVHTPGHSDDSISLLLDDGCAFTGDLMRYDYLDGSADGISKESWAVLIKRGAKKIYPAHGIPYRII